MGARDIFAVWTRLGEIVACSTEVQSPGFILTWPLSAEQGAQ